jgi:hypothetical protein
VCDELISLLAGLTSTLRTRASRSRSWLSVISWLSSNDQSQNKSCFGQLIGSCGRLWPEWRRALILVKPETVIRWHRKGFRFYWRRKNRERSGRPGVPKETRDLIRNMSPANVLWGAPRLHAELLKRGIEVSQATVAKYMVKPRKPPSQTWRTFLENYVKQLISVDFFVVPT